jgi:hypothetical protein
VVTKIFIPLQLSLVIANCRETIVKYAKNNKLKALAYFAILKTLSKSSKLSNKSYHQLMQEVARACNLSVNSAYNMVKLLKQHEFIEIGEKNGQHTIVLESWIDLCAKNGIECKDFYELQLNETIKPQLLLIKKAMQEKIGWQKVMRDRKLRNNVEKLRQFGVPLELLQEGRENELANFIEAHQIASYKVPSETFDFWHSFCTSLTLSIQGIKRIFGFKDWRQAAYWKHILADNNLIKIIPREVRSKNNKRQPHNVLTGEVVPMNRIWLQKTYERVWTMCDLITF